MVQMEKSIENRQSKIGNPAIDNRKSAMVKYQLALDVLRSFGQARLPVTGASMLPSIWPGDILEVRPDGVGEILPGELVLYVREGHLVAHRVVGIVREQGHTLLVTRGDRLKKPDPPVSPGELLGRVTWILRGNRRIVPRLTFWRRIASWVLCRSEFCTRLLLRLRLIAETPTCAAGTQKAAT